MTVFLQHFLNHPLIPKRALRINFFIDQKDIQRIKILYKVKVKQVNY